MRQRFTVNVDPDVMDAAKEVAYVNRVSLSRLVEKLIELAIADEEVAQYAVNDGWKVQDAEGLD